MKQTLILLLLSLSCLDLMAHEAAKTEFDPEARSVVEKQKNLLSFINKYIDSAFNKRESKDVFELYRNQESDIEKKRLQTTIDAQIAVIEGQKIRSITVAKASEMKSDDPEYKLGMIVAIQIQTDDYKIPVDLTVLLGTDGNWYLQEKSRKGK